MIVLPSPVAISAIAPSHMASAPMICTGYGRLPIDRQAASRARAAARSRAGRSSLPSAGQIAALGDGLAEMRRARARESPAPAFRPEPPAPSAAAAPAGGS